MKFGEHHQAGYLGLAQMVGMKWHLKWPTSSIATRVELHIRSGCGKHHPAWPMSCLPSACLALDVYHTSLFGPGCIPYQQHVMLSYQKLRFCSNRPGRSAPQWLSHFQFKHHIATFSPAGNVKPTCTCSHICSHFSHFGVHFVHFSHFRQKSWWHFHIYTITSQMEEMWSFLAHIFIKFGKNMLSKQPLK